ncbi:WAT1-related protein At2g39510-like isoform X2 [Coffea eugenioides]|uniref:WAT1-related protein n=1 Tax=Coffea arabica TaxID=13443 RepID=A0ABM4VPU5_COFAR|nr:WAT1-related protein At2g39510-like isoform X2 [Coffea eugenioides]
MELFKQAKPYLAVIFMQFGYAGSAIISKSALNKGMSHYAFAIYRNLFAAAVFAPFAVVLERKVRPRMTISVLWKIILLGLLEPVIDQNLYYAAMKYTTATFAVSMTNMLPALTFLLAWILRLEEVSTRRLHSQIKIAGTIITVGGAMIMTLVRGPAINLPWTRADANVQSPAAANPQDPIKGALMISAGCFCWASFHILQGVVTSGVGYCISGIIMRAKGPVFVTAFSPLSMVIVAFMSTFILAERLTFGRVFGAISIVTGLYLVIWGKCKDQISPSKSTNVDETDPIDEQLPDKNLTTKSSNDEKNDATKGDIAGGDNAV